MFKYTATNFRFFGVCFVLNFGMHFVLQCCLVAVTATHSLLAPNLGHRPHQTL